MKKTVLTTVSAALIATAACNTQAGVFSDTYETCKNGVCTVAAVPGKIKNDITSTYGAGLIGNGMYNTTTSIADAYHGLRFTGRSLSAISQPLTWLDVPYYAFKGAWNLAKAPVKFVLGATQLAVGSAAFVVHQSYKHPVLAATTAGLVTLAYFNPALATQAAQSICNQTLSAAGTALSLSFKGLSYSLKYSAQGASFALSAAGTLASTIPGVAGQILNSSASIMASSFTAFSNITSLVF